MTTVNDAGSGPKFDNEDSFMDLYDIHKPVSLDSWFNLPLTNDTSITSPLAEGVNSKSDEGYFGTYLFDYHHELQVQQKNLVQKLNQLQQLEQLMQSNGWVSDTASMPSTAVPPFNMRNDCNDITYSDEKSPLNTDLGSWISNNMDSTFPTDSLGTDVPVSYNGYTETPQTRQDGALKMSSVYHSHLDEIPRTSVDTSASLPENQTSISVKCSSSSKTGNIHRYICSDCGKGFARASSLRTHKNIHTGDRPFTCPFKNCGKCFNARSNMLRHHKLHFKTDCGLYMLPNGETTNIKPSSRKIFALSKQNEQYTALLTAYMNDYCENTSR